MLGRRTSTAAATALIVMVTGCSSGQPETAEQSPSASTAPTSRQPPYGPVEAVLAGMDRRAQVAQLFMAGVPLADLAGADELAGSGVGGVFLAGRSEAPPADLAAAAARWQSLSPATGLWVAADQEGGAVQSLRGPGFRRLPSAREQGTLPPDQLGVVAEQLGTELRAAGVNVDLAPVADVVPAGTEAGNEPIGAFDRQYGSTPEAVGTAVATIMDGLAAAGVTPTLKHFPGLGRVRENTDTSVGVTDPDTTADDGQVALFAELARSPADPFVMISSAVYPRIDPDEQAAFSPVVVTDLLRDRLEFDGVVISDDLGSARAVQDLAPGERATRFLAAGGTLVLTVDSGLVPEMIDAVLQRDATDPGFAATVDRAVRTALTAKDAAGLLPQ